MTMEHGNSTAFLNGEGTAKGGILRAQSRSGTWQTGQQSGRSFMENTFFPQCSKQRMVEARRSSSSTDNTFIKSKGRGEKNLLFAEMSAKLDPPPLTFADIDEKVGFFVCGCFRLPLPRRRIFHR